MGTSTVASTPAPVTNAQGLPLGDTSSAVVEQGASRVVHKETDGSGYITMVMIIAVAVLGCACVTIACACVLCRRRRRKQSAILEVVDPFEKRRSSADFDAVENIVLAAMNPRTGAVAQIAEGAASVPMQTFAARPPSRGGSVGPVFLPSPRTTVSTIANTNVDTFGVQAEPTRPSTKSDESDLHPAADEYLDVAPDEYLDVAGTANDDDAMAASNTHGTIVNPSYATLDDMNFSDPDTEPVTTGTIFDENSPYHMTSPDAQLGDQEGTTDKEDLGGFEMGDLDDKQDGDVFVGFAPRTPSTGITDDPTYTEFSSLASGGDQYSDHEEPAYMEAPVLTGNGALEEPAYMDGAVLASSDGDSNPTYMDFEAMDSQGDGSGGPTYSGFGATVASTENETEATYLDFGVDSFSADAAADAADVASDPTYNTLVSFQDGADETQDGGFKSVRLDERL